MNIESYSKIFNVGHGAVRDLLSTYPALIVEEKLDGSQISFRRNEDGTVDIRSKEAIVYPDNPGMFAAAVDGIMASVPSLYHGFIYRAEYLRKPKHNVLTYNRVPLRNIIVFDIQDSDGKFLEPAEKAMAASWAGLETVPHLNGYPCGRLSLDMLKGYLELESCLGGPKVEGVVIKPLGYDLWDQHTGKLLMAKYVSEQFKEKHKKEWPTRGDFILELEEYYRSEARWEKAIQHLAERGELENDPRDIGKLMKEAQRDLIEEEKVEIMDRLWAKFGDKVVRASTRGLAEWYKNRLAEGAFSEEQSDNACV